MDCRLSFIGRIGRGGLIGTGVAQDPKAPLFVGAYMQFNRSRLTVCRSRIMRLSALQALWKQANKTHSERQPNAKPNETADYESNHNIRHRAASHYEANAILALLFRFRWYDDKERNCARLMTR